MHASKPALPRFGSNSVSTSRMHALWKSEKRRVRCERESQLLCACICAESTATNVSNSSGLRFVDCGLRTEGAELLPPHFTLPHLVIDRLERERDRTFTCFLALSLSLLRESRRTSFRADGHAMSRLYDIIDNNIPRLVGPARLSSASASSSRLRLIVCSFIRSLIHSLDQRARQARMKEKCSSPRAKSDYPRTHATNIPTISPAIL